MPAPSAQLITLPTSVVSYTSEGTGRGLVMVHGTGLDARTNFGSVVEALAEDRTVILPSYAGTGDSTVPVGPLSLDLLVDQIEAVIAHAADEPVDLLGDSLGSVIAAAIAARCPQRIRRLVLIAPWADSSDPRHQLVFSTWARLQADSVALAAAFGIAVAISPRFVTTMGSAAIQAIQSAPPPALTRDRIDLGLRIDLRSELPKITASTLIITGRHDQLIPAYQSAPVQELIPSATTTVTDAGHAVLLEQPRHVLGLIRAHLDHL